MNPIKTSGAQNDVTDGSNDIGVEGLPRRMGFLVDEATKQLIRKTLPDLGGYLNSPECRQALAAQGKQVDFKAVIQLALECGAGGQ